MGYQLTGQQIYNIFRSCGVLMPCGKSDYIYSVVGKEHQDKLEPVFTILIKNLVSAGVVDGTVLAIASEGEVNEKFAREIARKNSAKIKILQAVSHLGAVETKDTILTVPILTKEKAREIPQELKIVCFINLSVRKNNVISPFLNGFDFEEAEKKYQDS